MDLLFFSQCVNKFFSLKNFKEKMTKKISLRKIPEFLLSITQKEKVLSLLIVLSVFSCFLFTMRVIATHDFYFLFLPWNLFLAWLPLWFSYWSYKISIENGFTWKSCVAIGLWF